ncbi:MAG: hypothetical protein ACP5O8_02630 [Candidatus Aenigmatarchaeota archaeon]
MKERKVGEWAFILGVLIAVFSGVVIGRVEGNVAIILILLGLFVGLMNIKKDEKKLATFLVAAIALLLSGTAGLENLPLIGSFIGPVLINITTFVTPAAVIIALKAVYNLAKKG